jgi:hypothetical protein
LPPFLTQNTLTLTTTPITGLKQKNNKLYFVNQQERKNDQPEKLNSEPNARGNSRRDVAPEPKTAGLLGDAPLNKQSFLFFQIFHAARMINELRPFLSSFSF